MPTKSRRLASSRAEPHRAGFVAIVGRPNVGKSTLLNRLVGGKVSITSRRPQTTRHHIIGIRTEPGAQLVFVDTPGFQTRHLNALNRSLNRAVTSTLKNVDAVLFVVEALRYGPEDRQVLRLLPKEVPALLAINKVDLLKDKSRLLPFIEQMSAEHGFAEVFPVSAEKGRQVEALAAALRAFLPEGPLLYGEDELTDRSERFLAAELLREKLFRLLGDEIPYATSVEVETFELEGKLRRIAAAVIVDKAGQKAIVIGRSGEKLKEVATSARKDMERLFGGKVFLEVWVKVRSGWADDERALKSLGYE
ncbi:MAG TPA: GTPase Era [Burkholderiales bacterium]